MSHNMEANLTLVYIQNFPYVIDIIDTGRSRSCVSIHMFLNATVGSIFCVGTR